MWEPKAGTGWRQRGDGGPVWGLMLEPGVQDGPCLFVTLHPDDIFEIGRSHASFEYECPGFADIQRVELDFDVPAWRVKGLQQNGPRIALFLQAVKP